MGFHWFGPEHVEPRLALAGSFLDGVVVGTLDANPIAEASGLVASQRNADVLWTHNDSGDSPRIFALNTQGEFLGSFSLAGATALDYEDIAIGPGPQQGISYLYVGDIGDNFAIRSAGIQAYRVAEPTVSSTGGDQSTALNGVDTITLVYPDGPRDAETLLVDPISGDLYVVTKRDPQNHVYRAAVPGVGSQTITLELIGQNLVGDGIPFESDGDRCDIFLSRTSPQISNQEQ